MAEKYFTITGMCYRYGNEFLEPKMRVNLVKEPDNDYDLEAIACESKYVEKLDILLIVPKQ